MRKGFIIFVIIFLFFLNRSDRYNQYDKGYEAAWEDKDDPSSFLWASQGEKDGYEDGSMDSWMYDEGYYDGYNNKKPKYLDDDFYLEGYNEGKKYR